MQLLRLIVLVCVLFSASSLFGQVVYEYMDLQTHPTMHVPYPFFSKGLQFFNEDEEPALSHKHQFNNVNYANYLLNNKGARIIIVGALTRETVKNPEAARKTILTQIEYVNNFVAENSENFAIAKTPAEVRLLVHNTEKTIIIHSIEGANKLINSQADANFWATQGVAFITLVHLIDSDHGSAAIKPNVFLKLINLKGSLRLKEKRGGLTAHGKNAIVWLANAGIMTDITHMSDLCRTEALEFMEQQGIPPISTHDLFKPIQNYSRGIPETQILDIYRNNGFVSLPISGISLMPYNPSEKYKAKLEADTNYCDGSIDSYKFTYQALKEHIESNHLVIAPNGPSQFLDRIEEDKVDFAIGFQSDFNGWLNHSKPRVGPKGCQEYKEGMDYEPIELLGLRHPGLLESQWSWLEKEGVDLDPIKRSSEKFLQLWELFQNRSRTID